MKIIYDSSGTKDWAVVSKQKTHKCYWLMTLEININVTGLGAIDYVGADDGDGMQTTE